jgi:hypothetical protein
MTKEMKKSDLAFEEEFPTDCDAGDLWRLSSIP